jgi:hypothetical protein
MKYHACRWHAAIPPAEISASFPRQRQLRKDCTPRSQRQPYRALGTPKVVQIPHKP